MTINSEPVKSLGSLLVAKGLLSEEQVRHILEDQRNTKRPFGVIAVSLGFVTESNLLQTVCEQYKPLLPNIQIISNIEQHDIEMTAALAVLEEFPSPPLWIPLTSSRIAANMISDFMHADETLDKLGLQSAAMPYLAPRSVIQGGWSYVFKQARRDEVSENSPLRKIQDTLADAWRQGASDIHIEPSAEDGYEIVYRIHGRLARHQAEKLSREEGRKIYNALLNRTEWKMNSNEKNRPQDGSGEITVDGRKVRFRIVTIPLAENRGFYMVFRLLHEISTEITVGHLNFSPQVENPIRRVIQAPHGLFLTTGPTGSGKTTLMYTLLSEIARIRSHDNIITVEDPVESQLTIARQIHGRDPNSLTKEEKEHNAPTMATIIRNILRADPDVLLIGEIRDLTSAQLAMEAAMTGHLVLSTLHTNRAEEVITRLRHIGGKGIELDLLAGSFLGAVAQLLAPDLCPHCRQDADWSLLESEWERAGLNEKYFDNARKNHQAFDIGTSECSHCHNHRIIGRVPVAEVMLLNEEDRRNLRENGVYPRVKIPIFVDGLIKVAEGRIPLSWLLGIMAAG